MKTLTVFTPTYNRVKYLPMCYESLLAQNNMDFVWQIVDDGSEDGTEELIKFYIAENKIDIVYHKKPNGGKASAINYSLETTDTPLWVCLDSDDYMWENGVDSILKVCDGIENMPNVCGAFGVRSDKDGNPMKGKGVPKGVEYATQFDLRYKYKVPTEYVQVYKTDIIKEYHFPMYEGEKFVTESWLQDQLDCKYVFKIFNEPVMVCEYLPDGLTNNYWKLIKKNPKGFLDFYGRRTEICKIIRPRFIAGIMYNAVYSMLGDKTLPRKKNFVIGATAILGKIFAKKFKKL